jgi:hypothetical protein
MSPVRRLSRPLGRPANDGSDPATKLEQTTLVLGLKAHISEAGEMQHRPEAIGSIEKLWPGGQRELAVCNSQSSDDDIGRSSVSVMLNGNEEMEVSLGCRAGDENRWLRRDLDEVSVLR